MASPMSAATTTPTAMNVPMTWAGLRRKELLFSVLLSENEPVGLATTCVNTTDAPEESVEVPTLVIWGGADLASCPSELVKVIDTGVEKVEKGWSVIVLVIVGTDLASGWAGGEGLLGGSKRVVVAEVVAEADVDVVD